MTVSFAYSTWVARYPEFSAVTEPVAQLYFDEACLYCDNTGAGPVKDERRLALLLNMLTAHIAFMNGPNASGLVGRINSASEGSVSVSTDAGTMPGTAAWFMSSKYGAAFYQATAQQRTARIYRGQPRNIDPFNPMWRR
jgi:hypothetical protein